MDILIAILTFALLFALFAVSRVAERTRPCAGRGTDGERRCRTCPLQEGDSGRFGPCPGSDGSPSRSAVGEDPRHR